MSPTNERRNAFAWRILAVALLLALVPVAASAENAVLARASGQVELGRGEPPAWQAAVLGDAVAPGDRLRTGRDGRAELAWQGSTIRLYGDSMLRLPTETWSAKTTGVDLERGSSLFDVQHRDGGSFEVHTPDVVVSVKGTRFGVGVDGGPDQVWVYRGTVGVRALTLEGAREVMVREGFRAVGGAQGPAEVFVLDHADPWDGWAKAQPPRSASAAPPARRADDAARESVHQAAQDRALALTLARRPELADRLATMQAKLKEETDREMKAEDRAELPDASSVVDPVLDATVADVENALKSRYIERVLSSPSQTLTVTLAGDGIIELLDKQGVTSQVAATDLAAFLEGNAPLPANLDAVISSSGRDRTETAALILGLLGR
jgi:hypothetical protein